MIVRSDADVPVHFVHMIVCSDADVPVHFVQKNSFKLFSWLCLQFTNLFSLRSWRRKLHIWSPNYTSTLALHKLRKWLRFGYAIATIVIRSSFLMQSCFWHGHHVQKVCGPAYAHIKSCNSDAGFGAERSRNSLHLGENVRVEEASVWNFFRRRFSVSLQRLCYCDEKEESSIPEISPSLSRSLSVFASFEFKERQRTCSLHHLQIGLSWQLIWL